MSLLCPTAHTYAEAYSSPEPTLLAHIRQETIKQVPGATMLAGHLQGRVLATFSQMIKPQRILEIGTYTGYSTLCLAEGLAPGGNLYTIDCNKELTERVNQYFLQSEYADAIHYHVGKATDILPTLPGPFDLIFIDADKKNYPLYYEISLEKLNKNGFLIIDNVLWKGKVFEKDPEKTDKKTQAITECTQTIHNDTRVEHVLLPIRDGLMVVRKK